MDTWGMLMQDVLTLLINAIGRFIAWTILVLNGEFVADPVAFGVLAILLLFGLMLFRRRQATIRSEEAKAALQSVAIKQPVVVQSPGGLFAALIVGFVSGVVVLALLFLYAF